MTNGCMDIKINSVDDAVEIQKIANDYDEDINIYSGSIVFDAKSIISMINLCGMPNIHIKMLAYDARHETEFNNRMKKFEKRD